MKRSESRPQESQDHRLKNALGRQRRPVGRGTSTVWKISSSVSATRTTPRKNQTNGIVRYDTSEAQVFAGTVDRS
jgi:hypothetical protein